MHTCLQWRIVGNGVLLGRLLQGSENIINLIAPLRVHKYYLHRRW